LALVRNERIESISHTRANIFVLDFFQVIKETVVAFDREFAMSYIVIVGAVFPPGFTRERDLVGTPVNAVKGLLVILVFGVEAVDVSPFFKVEHNLVALKGDCAKGIFVGLYGFVIFLIGKVMLLRVAKPVFFKGRRFFCSRIKFDRELYRL
jgi:hypothetical protein